MKACPLMAEPCKQKECMFWDNDACLIVTALACHVDNYTSIVAVEGDTESLNDPDQSQLEGRNAEELAKEMLDFAKSYLVERFHNSIAM